jgi:hypothetical protein
MLQVSHQQTREIYLCGHAQLHLLNGTINSVDTANHVHCDQCSLNHLYEYLLPICFKEPYSISVKDMKISSALSVAGLWLRSFTHFCIKSDVSVLQGKWLLLVADDHNDGATGTFLFSATLQHGKQYK